MNNDSIIKGNESKKKKKKMIFIIIVIAVIAAVIVTVVVKNLKSGDDGAKVYTASVAEITGYGSVGAANRFTGIVESQKPVMVNYDSNKTIKTTFVNVGDEVQIGTQLFEYDTDEINNSIDEMQLEIDKLNLEISSAQEQIKELQNEKNSAPAEEQLSYTMEIQSLTSEISSNQYDVKTKSAELQKLKDSLSNAVITSTAAGIIKSIGESGSSDYDNYSDEGGASSQMSPYIAILPVGDYQIKGVLNELNKDDISEGTPVIVTSRVNEEVHVTGTVSKIDFNNTVSSGSSEMYMDDEEGDSGETGSKWNFYVTFDNSAGLMLGQHVFIEPDYGQNTEREGLWLSEFYLAQDDDESYYVWKEKDGKITKQKLELGEYNQDEMTYEVLGGITPDDYIAFPSDDIEEGQKCSHSIEDFDIDDIDDVDVDADAEDFDNEDIDDEDYDDEDLDDEDAGDEDADDEDIDDEDYDDGDVDDEDADGGMGIGLPGRIASGKEAGQ